MPLSHVVLGRPAVARALVQRIGPDALEFFSLAQRCAWATILPEIIHLDVAATLARLRARLPGFFATHLVAAFVEHAQGNVCAAEGSLSRARSLVLRNDPLAYLLPRDEEWRGCAPEQQLHEVVPGHVWRVPAHFPAPHTPFQWHSVGTLIRSGSELAMINPVGISPSVARQIGALGTMTLLVTATKVHHRYVDELRRTFPGVRHLGVEAHAKHPASRNVVFDGALEPGQPVFRDLEHLCLRGFDFCECAFLHRPSKLLIVEDFICANLADEPEVPFAFRLYNTCFGVHDGFGPMCYQLPMYTDLAALRTACKRVLAWDFTGAVGAHWRCRPYTGARLEEFRSALRWLASLSGLEHKRLLLRFAFHQPGILLDYIRYDQRQRRNAADARMRSRSVTA